MSIILVFSLLTLFVGSNSEINSSHIGCFVEGECALYIDLHNLVEIIENISTPKDCLDRCKEFEKCLFFTHFEMTEKCYLYSSCEYFFYQCETDDCISGESTCNTDVMKDAQDVKIL